MARHNREANGCDQRGFEYTVSYQPDWLRQVKVTRRLDNGRQSTKTLYVNPDDPQRDPGRQVRTGIRSADQDISFEVMVTDPDRVVRRIIVETGPADLPAGGADAHQVQFTIEHRP